MNISYEQNRLLSLIEQGWPKEPIDNLHPIGARQLAKWGFYCPENEGCMVKCIFCGEEVRGWITQDTAQTRHKTLNGSIICPFTNGLDVGNVKIGLENKYRRRHTTYTERLETYQNWPPQIPIKPEQLAAPGFSYTNKGDLVVCCNCCGGLKGWTANADPWAEHALNFPSCRLVDNVTVSHGYRAVTTAGLELIMAPYEDDDNGDIHFSSTLGLQMN